MTDSAVRVHTYAAQAMRSFLGAPPVYSYTPYGSRWGKPWSEQEISTLEAMAGKTGIFQICDKLGRSEKSVRKMAHTLGVRLAVRKPTPTIDAASVAQAEAIYKRFSRRHREIIDAVSEETGVEVVLIFARSRQAKLVQARQRLIWRLVRDTNMSMSQIAMKMDRDATTARHAVLCEDARQGTNVHAKRAGKYGYGQ